MDKSGREHCVFASGDRQRDVEGQQHCMVPREITIYYAVIISYAVTISYAVIISYANSNSEGQARKMRNELDILSTRYHEK